MGKVLSISSLARKVSQNFNIETRAQKVISQSKPKVAPLHKANQEELESILRQSPESVEKLNLKDGELYDRLKHIYVSSKDEIVQPPSTRPLPTERTPVDDFEFGHKEEPKASHGKIRMRDVLEFFNNNNQDPETYDAKKMNQDYGIPIDTAENIIKHFRLMMVHQNDSKNQKLPNRDFFKDTQLIEGQQKKSEGQSKG